MMSALFTALTALLVYDIVTGSPGSPAKGNTLAGVIAGVAYGLSPLAWSQAVITEVYGLHIFFVALLLWLLLGRYAGSPNKLSLDVAVGLSLGLAMGNHLTSVFLLPAVLLVGVVDPLVWRSRRKHGVLASLDWAALGRRLGGLFAGLLVYVVIPWRAASGAPVNWGDATNLGKLWWLVSGDFYHHYAFSLPLEYLPLRILSVASLLLTQFGVLGLLAGLFHLIRSPFFSRLSLVGVWVALANVIFSLGYSTSDSYIYLLPFFLVFALWIGLGVGEIDSLLARQGSWASLIVSAILLAVSVGMALLNYPKLDLSADHHAQKFEQAVFAALPPQAIVVAKGDQALFSLWYYHFILKERPDVAILADGLLSFPWYIDVLHATYPTLNISPDAPSPQAVAHANPTRPTCEVLVTNEQIEQLSLLCYPPGSYSPDAPSVSILQPIGQ
jgi:hypothetical protein